MPSVSAGRLDRRVSLLRRVLAAPDVMGYRVAMYFSYATIWASKNDLAGTKRIIAQQITEQGMTEFTIRFRRDVLLTDRLQLLETGNIYDITDVGELGRHEGLSLLCRENPDAAKQQVNASAPIADSERSSADMIAGIGGKGVPDSTAGKGVPNDGDAIAATRAVLIADPAVLAICGTRIYPVLAPQDAQFPYVILTVTHVLPYNAEQGYVTPDRVEIELDAWSQVSPLESETLARTCRKSLEAVPILCTGAAQQLFSADVEPPVFRTGYFFQLWQ